MLYGILYLHGAIMEEIQKIPHVGILKGFLVKLLKEMPKGVMKESREKSLTEIRKQSMKESRGKCVKESLKESSSNTWKNPGAIREEIPKNLGRNTWKKFLK